YQSRKFSRGRLSCGISIFSYYPLSQWKHVVQKLERNYGIRDKFNETHLSFYANELEESVELNSKSLDCEISISSTAPIHSSSTFLYVDSSMAELREATFLSASCYGLAIATHFPTLN